MGIAHWGKVEKQIGITHNNPVHNVTVRLRVGVTIATELQEPLYTLSETRGMLHLQE